MSDFSALSIRPIIEYPREVRIGKTYLMTINLQPEKILDWHYEAEEYPIYCEVDSNLFKIKPIEDAVIILHRFGGSYGMAKFLLSVFKNTEVGYIKTRFFNRWGVLIRTEILEGFEILSEIPEAETHYLKAQELAGFYRLEETELLKEATDHKKLFSEILAYVNYHVREYSSRSLNEVEETILRYTWEGLTYKDMAKHLGYNPNTLRTIHGHNLWKLLEDVWPKHKISKLNFSQVVEALYNNQTESQIVKLKEFVLNTSSQSEDLASKKEKVSFENILDYVNSCVQDYAGRLLTGVETDILRLTWEENLSYAAMARRMGYAQSTLRGVYGYELWKLLGNVWPNGEKVSKSRFRSVAKRRYQSWLRSQQNDRASPPDSPPDEQTNRLLERSSLASRILEVLSSGYHSIILTGAAGIGKTHLLRALQSELSRHFIHVVYQPTHEMPSWQVWHRMLFPDDQELDPTAELQLRQQVIETLNQASYLVVVDRSERFLDEPQYNRFFSDISAAVSQQSCLLWSSDIIPVDFDQHTVALETIGELSFAEAKELLAEQYPPFEGSIAQ
ncbi:MAG: ATP-binding protein, partial [Leptolyngbyaceae cyanobacterium]